VGKVSIKIQSRTLNQLFMNYKIDLIKVDVEGSEFKVMMGADRIMKNVKAWLIEMHDIEQLQQHKKFCKKRMKEPNKRMDDLLKGNGYETKWINERWVYAERK